MGALKRFLHDDAGTRGSMNLALRKRILYVYIFE